MLNLNINTNHGSNLGMFRELRQATPSIVSKALNRVAPTVRTRVAKRIGGQVNFPANYLTPASKRLYVSKKATRGSLETRIAARMRPTSLARFSDGKVGKRIRLQVKAGGAKFVGSRAFLIRLRAGRADLDTKSNLGLAIRLRPGERISNKIRQVKFQGLTLLYGPSVAQLALDNQGDGAFTDLSGEAGDRMVNEVIRLIDAGIK